MCQIYLLDPCLKLLESNTLKAAVPQNVNDRTYTTACNPANSSKITHCTWEGRTVTKSACTVSHNTVRPLDYCYSLAWLSSLRTFPVLRHHSFHTCRRFFAWVSALFSSPFPPRKAWYSNYFIFTRRFRATKCLSKSIKFSGILLILILVVSFVYTWTRRNFRLLGESLRGNKTKCSWRIQR